MQTTQWTQRTHISVIDELINKPQAYEFMQAVRLIWHHEAKKQQYNADNSKRDYNYPYLKFKSSISLAFPVAEIESLTPQHYEPSQTQKELQADLASADKTSAESTHIADTSYIQGFELCPTMIGLTGPVGTLPYVYTQSLFGRVTHYRDRAAPAFLNIFNHRLTELYVHASWFYSLPIQYELNPKNDSYINCLKALASQPLKQLSDLDAMVSYTGLLRPSRLTAEQIAQVLTAYFQVAVNVEQFIPEWFDLPTNQQSRLGYSNAKLGVETFLGSRVLQFDTKIRISFANLDEKTYLDLLPDGNMTRVVFEFLRQWCGSNMAIEMQLELDKKYIKPLSLQATDFGALGQGAFLISKAAEEHNKDTRFDLGYGLA